MEGLLMAAVVAATIALGAFRKDRYDFDAGCSQNRYCGKGARRKGKVSHRSVSHRYIADYDRHPLSHTHKLR